MKRALYLAAASVYVMCAAASFVGAETYPSNDITLVIAHEVGSLADIGPRTLLPYWEKYLGGKILIVNKPGAGGELGYTLVSKSKPDGYTLGNWVIPTPQGQQATRKTGFKNEDFDYIGNQQFDPHAIVVRSDDERFKTIKEFLDYAALHPEEITTSFNVHSDDHLAMDRLSRLFNLKFKIVFGTGSAQARTSILGKYIDFMIDNVGYFMGYAGKDKPLRVLAYCWKERYVKLDPTAPTLEEATGKKLVSATYRAFIAPKGVPADRLGKLRESLKKAMEDPEYIKEAEKHQLLSEYLSGEGTEKASYEYQAYCNEFWKKK